MPDLGRMGMIKSSLVLRGRYQGWVEPFSDPAQEDFCMPTNTFFDTDFEITEHDLRCFQARQSNSGPINHPIRDAMTTTFFQVIMSDDADFLQQGFVSPDSAKLLGHDNEGE